MLVGDAKHSPRLRGLSTYMPLVPKSVVTGAKTGILVLGATKRGHELQRLLEPSPFAPIP